MNLHSIRTIAWWEFIQKAKTKAFLVSVIMSPVFMVIFSVLPVLLATSTTEEVKTLLILDEHQTFGNRIAKSIDTIHYSNGDLMFKSKVIQVQSLDSIIKKKYQSEILQGTYAAMLCIPSTIYEKKEVEYHGQHVSNARELEYLERVVFSTIEDSLLRKYSIQKENYTIIQNAVNVKTIKLQQDGTSDDSSFLSEFAGVYGTILIILIMVSFSGQQLIRSLLDEKTNRIIEILLSSVTPLELMSGKLIGLGALGLTQALFWLLFAYIGTTFSQANITVFSSIHLIFIYAMLGYLLFASIMIGLGSLATTEQEAQTMTGYITMLTSLPFVLMFVIVENPSGTISTVCSYIPFLTPSVMSARIALQMPHWSEILITILLLIISIIGSLWISAKLFTVGMLTYGKRISLKQASTIVIQKKQQ